MILGYSQMIETTVFIRSLLFRTVGIFVLVGIASFLLPSDQIPAGFSSAYAQENSKLIIDVAVSETAPEPGKTFSYTIRYRCASLTKHCTNTVISDAIPPSLSIVSYTKVGGNVSATDLTDNVITWELQSSTGTSGQLEAGSAGMLFVRVRFPVCSDDDLPAAVSTLPNVATISEDGGPEVASDSSNATITVPGIPICEPPVEPPPGDFQMTDSGEPVVSPGSNEISYEVALPTSPEPYQVQLDLPEGLMLESLNLGEALAAGGIIVATCGGTNVNLSETLTGNLNRADDVPADCTVEEALASPNAVLFTNMTGLEVTIPANVSLNNPLNLSCTLEHDFPVGDVIRNQASLIEPVGIDLNNDGNSGQTVTSVVEKLVLDPSLMGSIAVHNFITPGFVGPNGDLILDGDGTLPERVITDITTHKNLILNSVYLAKNDVVWQIRAQLRNDGTVGLDWVDPLFIHDLPPEVDFIVDPERGNFVQMAILNMNNISADYDPFNQPACHTPELTVKPDFERSGRTRVEMRFPGCTIYGGLQQYTGLSMYMSGRMKPGVLAATELTSKLRMVSENGPELRCFGFDKSYDSYCETSSTITVSVMNAVDTYAFVKGAYAIDGAYELAQEPNMPMAHIAREFGIRGPAFNCLTACAASNQAIGEACDLIRRGDADVMISGGTHTMLHVLGITGFNRLTALSTRNDDIPHASRPFSRTRDGFVMGEGSGIIVLESLEHAQARGATILGEVTGYGSTADAYRITDIHPEGRGPCAAMHQALADAGIDLDTTGGDPPVQYISAHGTGTQENDKIETGAVKRVFGELAPHIPMTSIKSMMGHLICAAGAVEFITCLLIIRDGVIPPTINLDDPDPDLDLDYVPNTARNATVDTCLSNAFGFGGQNDTLIVTRAV